MEDCYAHHTVVIDLVTYVFILGYSKAVDSFLSTRILCACEIFSITVTGMDHCPVRDYCAIYNMYVYFNPLTAPL